MQGKAADARPAVRANVTARMSYFQIENAPRLASNAPPVRAFGFAPSKTELVDRDFVVVGFSFIVRGKGRWECEGCQEPVVGPCMLIQRPGRHYRYGPQGTWDELYVTYAATCLKHFQTPAWLTLGEGVVPLPERHLLLFHRNEIVAASRNLNRIAGVDRIDVLFASLLLDVLAASREARAQTHERRLYAVKEAIDAHYPEPISLKELCAKHLLSERSLLRQWRQTFGGTPGHYLTALRLRRACELLVSSDLPIGEVAEESGFTDPLYFSRRFHAQMGMPPGRYRQSNR